MSTHPSHPCPRCGTALGTSATRARTCPACSALLHAPAGGAPSARLAPTVCKRCWSHIGPSATDQGRCPSCEEPL